MSLSWEEYVVLLCTWYIKLITYLLHGFLEELFLVLPCVSVSAFKQVECIQGKSLNEHYQTVNVFYFNCPTFFIWFSSSKFYQLYICTYVFFSCLVFYLSIHLSNATRWTSNLFSLFPSALELVSRLRRKCSRCTWEHENPNGNSSKFSCGWEMTLNKYWKK